MDELIEPIFQLDDVLQFSYNREKEDYIKISPVTGTNLNTPGQKTFEVNNQQNYIYLADSFLRCEFTITKKDGTALGNDDITLEHNFFPRCFTQMRLLVGGREVENIASAVGEASTIANFIMASNTFRRTYGQISGWTPDTHKGDIDVTGEDCNRGYYWRKKLYNEKKKLVVMFPLKYLFGFTEYTKILYLIKLSLCLIRKDDAIVSEDVFYGAATTTGKIKFESLEWWIPSITPSDKISEIITQRLITDKPIDVIFMKRHMAELVIQTGPIVKWNLGNFDNCKFIFSAFKSTDPPSAQKNNALFVSHIGTDKITSLRVQINTMYYPADRMEFNFLEANFLEPYISMINCCKIFGNEPQLSAQEFRDL